MSDLNAAYRWLDDEGPAFGAPGVEPRWTSSEKDAVSTAYAASSRVWFTVSHGTLNEIYYPTIDRPQTAGHGVAVHAMARRFSMKRSATWRMTFSTSTAVRRRCGLRAAIRRGGTR